MNKTAKYKKKSERHLSVSTHDRASTTSFAQWLIDEGLALYEDSFRHETGKKLPKLGEGQLVEQAYAGSVNDGRKRATQGGYYAANARIFLSVTETLANGVIKANKDKRAAEFASRHFQILQGLTLDSRVLLEDWATRKAEVPGTFGIWKSPRQHPFQIAHAARQMMFAGSPFFSFQDNAIDAGTALLRVAIETRLRSGFGLIAVEEIASGAVLPLNLSKILEAIALHAGDVTLGIPLPHISRLYGWSNSYIHTGARSYMWSPIFALDYLQPLLMGGDYPRGYSADAGIQLPAAVLADIQAQAEALLRIDPSKERLIKLSPSECSAIVAP